MEDSAALDLAEIAASSGFLTDRAQSMLDRLRRAMPFDAAWVALTDPVSGRYRSLLAVDLDESTDRYPSDPKMADDIETTQTNRRRPPLSPSDLPYPAEDLAAWAECFIPAGFHEALAVGLCTADHRHVGFLALLFETARPPTPAVRRRLHELSPVLAQGVDPIRSLAVATRVLDGAIAGAALCRDGTPRPLPGLAGDELLFQGSPVTALSRRDLADGLAFASFLWPRGKSGAPEDHVVGERVGHSPRVTEGPCVGISADAATPPGWCRMEERLGVVMADAQAPKTESAQEAM